MIIRSLAYCTVFCSLLGCAAASAQNAPPTAAAPSTAQPANAAAAAPDSSASQDDVIHLHMPVHHRPRSVQKPADTAAPAANPSVDAIGADTTFSPSMTATPSEAPVAPPPQAPAPTKPAKASHTTKQQPAAAIPFSFGDESESTSAPPAPTPQKTSGAKPPFARETRTAALPPQPVRAKTVQALVTPSSTRLRARDDEHAGLSRRGAVLFDRGVSSPSPTQFAGVKLLAGNLSAALEAGASRVQLEAYGGAPGDKSSDARRLSLRRALAVRQLLIDNGVPSSHIVVRAMGGVDDHGPDDRVDIFVSS